MTRVLAVLRPEPGNAATRERAEIAGFATVALPLFEVRALAWDAPDPGAFDALILTSANALRFGGGGLAAFTSLDGGAGRDTLSLRTLEAATINSSSRWLARLVVVATSRPLP